MQLRSAKWKLALDLFLIAVVAWVFAIRPDARYAVSYLFAAALLFVTGIHCREFVKHRALSKQEPLPRPDWDYSQAIQLLESWTTEAKASVDRREAKRVAQEKHRIAWGWTQLLVASLMLVMDVALFRGGRHFQPLPWFYAPFFAVQGVINLSMGFRAKHRGLPSQQAQPTMPVT